MRTSCVTADDALPLALVDYLQKAERIAVLTGAGMSAESGVPTFREAQTGLWERYDPLELATPEAFERDPQLVWDWYQWRRELVERSVPNAGHLALAELQKRIPGFTLITQNVDGLHELAGSEEVLELHGNICRSICSRTRQRINPEWLARHCGQSPIPSPHHPQGLVRPDVVWFRESLDSYTLQRAIEAAADCQLMLVIGTSGLVHPAASIPMLAVERNALMIEVNPAASELSRHARWRLDGSAATWLPRLVAALRS